jgi:soluble cytochrome b562
MRRSTLLVLIMHLLSASLSAQDPQRLLSAVNAWAAGVPPFRYAFTDLDGDGRADALVLLRAPESCGSWSGFLAYVRKYFFECEWFEVYDFLEFVANNHDDEGRTGPLIFRSNVSLESEMSAYRFVDKCITQITSQVEIEAIEEAISTPLKAVSTHLETSLGLLSDKKAPDYRNSIKESISAVEAMCKLISKKDKGTLAEALKSIKTIEIHPALKKAFDSMYGYTSDEDGVRHSVMEESDLKFEDAKFMLVSCSAFVNYLTSKANGEGIALGTL